MDFLLNSTHKVFELIMLGLTLDAKLFPAPTLPAMVGSEHTAAVFGLVLIQGPPYSCKSYPFCLLSNLKTLTQNSSSSYSEIHW